MHQLSETVNVLISFCWLKFQTTINKQIQTIQKQLKTLEDKIKEKEKERKVKTITISEEVHSKIKKYCVDKDLKINEWVEAKLLELISK